MIFQVWILVSSVSTLCMQRWKSAIFRGTERRWWHLGCKPWRSTDTADKGNISWDLELFRTGFLRWDTKTIYTHIVVLCVSLHTGLLVHMCVLLCKTEGQQHSSCEHLQPAYNEQDLRGRQHKSCDSALDTSGLSEKYATQGPTISCRSSILTQNLSSHIYVCSSQRADRFPIKAETFCRMEAVDSVI